MESGNNALDVVTGTPVKAIEAMRSPEAVLSEAKNAARALSVILEQRPKKIIINGKRHLEFDDWQTMGRFYSIAVKTHDAQPVEIGGIKGAKAQADVIDVKTGIVIGGAEAYCMKDEPNWRTKPWFQLASMAQTRAGAKALRNVLSWVVVLAGYSGTPAEEMEGIGNTQIVPEESAPAASSRANETVVHPTRVLDRKSKNTGKKFWKVVDDHGKEYFVFHSTIAEIATKAMLEGKNIRSEVETGEVGAILHSAVIQ